MVLFSNLYCNFIYTESLNKNPNLRNNPNKKLRGLLIFVYTFLNISSPFTVKNHAFMQPKLWTITHVELQKCYTIQI